MSEPWALISANYIQIGGILRALSEVGSFLATNYLQVIDTLAVAALIYYTFLYARGTKIIVVLQAIILLGVLHFICQYFKLITLVFIIEKILLVGPLALFIIFAPEIRKMLERAGRRSRVMEWLAPREQDVTQGEIVDIVIDAVRELAEARTGALIVFETDEPVDGLIVPGTVMDAAPSKRLLLSIFDHHNTMHDGAVVIRQERIYSAGNFLPISEATPIYEDLGTRHLAAIGLTERSPALVVIVSEQRGTVSLAHHGRLAKDLTNEQFIEQIWALIEPNENFSSPVPRASMI